jgi:hypothetical protein
MTHRRESDYTVTKCLFQFKQDEWTEPVAGRTERLPDEWTCPHEALESEDYCPFHSADASASVVRDAFRAALADGTTETNSFVGARLSDLNLSDETVTANSTIDLRAVTFTEGLNLEDTQFQVPVRFGGSHFCGRLEIDDTRFEREVTFYGCKFDGVVEGSGTTFEQNAYFIGTCFSHSLLLTSNTTFDGDVFFTGTTFQSAADLSNATIDGKAFFHDVAFQGRTTFDRTVFHDDVRFAGSTFTGSLSFEHSHVHGVLQFGGEGIDRRYDAATFNCPLVLEHMYCKGRAYFVDCAFETGVRLVKSDFEDMVDLSGVTLSDTLDLTRSTFEDLRLTPREVEERLLADGTETIINTGLIRHPTEGKLFCHFEQATIGAVEFVAEDSMEEAPQQLDLRWVRFVDTAYDGFDFTRYRRCLEPDWQLHQFTAAESADDIEPSPIEKELTYMRAKSGADDIGDNRAAGKFFQREMRARGARHKQNFLTDTSFRAGYRYVGNRAFWLSSNYAESPQRVLGNSFLLIVIFAGLYAIGFQTGEFPTPYSDSPLLGYLLLSGESFVTLVHSPAAPIPSASLRAVAIFEGFLGAFAIALFLFTLTRAVHR